jgi:ABC-type polar amino acid transport system ATPase subunit
MADLPSKSNYQKSITGLRQQTGSAVLYGPEFKILNITTFCRREIILIFGFYEGFQGMTVVKGVTLSLFHMHFSKSDRSWNSGTAKLLLNLMFSIPKCYNI